MEPSLPVYVLIGGLSRRFGAAKATHLVEGQPWALHVASRLTADLSLATLVGKQLPDELSGMCFVADDPRAEGPLAGALAAVVDRRERYGEGQLVLASCDLVRPQSAWLEPLIEAQQGSAHTEVSAYRIDGRWQPFPMVAHTDWVGTMVAHLAQGGKASFQALLDASRVAAVPWAEVPASGPPQANTVDQLTELLGV